MKVERLGNGRKRRRWLRQQHTLTRLVELGSDELSMTAREARRGALSQHAVPVRWRRVEVSASSRGGCAPGKSEARLAEARLAAYNRCGESGRALHRSVGPKTEGRAKRVFCETKPIFSRAESGVRSWTTSGWRDVFDARAIGFVWPDWLCLARFVGTGWRKWR